MFQRNKPWLPFVPRSMLSWARFTEFLRKRPIDHLSIRRCRRGRPDDAGRRGVQVESNPRASLRIGRGEGWAGLGAVERNGWCNVATAENQTCPVTTGWEPAGSSETRTERRHRRRIRHDWFPFRRCPTTTKKKDEVLIGFKKNVMWTFPLLDRPNRESRTVNLFLIHPKKTFFFKCRLTIYNAKFEFLHLKCGTQRSWYTLKYIKKYPIRKSLIGRFLNKQRQSL